MATVTKLDYYEVLTVSRTASDAELKTAYRRLAMQYHPDRNQGDPSAEEKFKECSEAYQVLSDPDKRAAYDRYGHAGVGAAGPGGGSPFTNAQDIGDIFGDIFGEMFGQQGGRGGRGSRQQRGRDLRYDQTIDFTEAIFGKEIEVSVKRMEPCEECVGTGTKSSKGPTTCRQCGGRGQVRFQQGFFSVARTCTHCGGTGQVISDPCPNCHGDGRAEKLHTVRVSIPAGVEEGTRIRYQGGGDAGRFGGPAGDLYIVLTVKPHSFFERDGNDVHCIVPISFTQAALGDEITIPTLEGDTRMKVPEGTQSGKEFRMRGKGVPYLNEHGRGDLIVEVAVQTPKKLTREQRELLRQFGEGVAIENAPTSRSLFTKLKEILS
ncbi:molecular chaperone DnaJ [Acidipila sp. EB88]|uniref:molecular chaperone DnaJ n=1 Tax=Acidipila sp. EB88 TaxID=2305226 RepID=UPI000F603F95|nr:molecular chaperone DnaJ [Acidipila sp. EB88]